MGLKVAFFCSNALVHSAITEVLKSLSGFDIVCSSHHLSNLVSKVRTTKIDLVLVEISRQTAQTCFDLIQSIRLPKLGIDLIILAPASSEGGGVALRAFEYGATDFVAVPIAGDDDIRARLLRLKLGNVLEGYKRKQQIATNNKILHVDAGLLREISQEVLEIKSSPRKKIKFTPELVAIGISTGGPSALAELVPRLDGVVTPILIVQHMPPYFTSSLAQSLNNKSQLRIKEAEDGDLIEKRHVYIAPGGKQMMVVKGDDGRGVIKITTDAPVNNCRPSVDYLYSSLAKAFPAKVLAVIMTGMGNDGAKGCVEIRNGGGVVFAQDEASSAVFGMPREAVKKGGVDKIVSLAELATEIELTLANPNLAISKLPNSL